MKNRERQRTQRGGAHTRQAKMKPLRSNPKGVVEQSPGLARHQPWVIARPFPSTPTGLRPSGRKTSRLRSLPATTPLGLIATPSPLPRVVPSVQPWALLHNRVAVKQGRSQQLRFRTFVASFVATFVEDGSTRQRLRQRVATKLLARPTNSTLRSVYVTTCLSRH